jgi:hypothetical protein
VPPNGVRCCKCLGPKCRILRALYKGITVAPLPCRYGAHGPEVCVSKNTHVYIGLTLGWWLGSEWQRFQFRELQWRTKVRHQYVELHARSFISSLLRVKETETCALKCAVIVLGIQQGHWQGFKRMQSRSERHW